LPESKKPKAGIIFPAFDHALRKNLTFDSHLDKKHPIGVGYGADDHFSPILYRFRCDSLGGLSSFRQNAKKMFFAALVTPEKFVCRHVMNLSGQ
jgi:hypothetical protein